ncbi:MAG TPA: hypothetical protein DCP92_16845, partial [Nitrospiraceae bacterium]|nr:hypothetical protein [Nitrospiraceae bacterium]
LPFMVNFGPCHYLREGKTQAQPNWHEYGCRFLQRVACIASSIRSAQTQPQVTLISDDARKLTRIKRGRVLIWKGRST